MIRVLFVCLGNICRSPTAHAVFAGQVRRAGLDHLIEIDSAGTSSCHQGEAPDLRAQQVGAARGYDLSTLCSRPVVADDYRRFDYLLAMDQSNLAVLEQQAPDACQAEIGLFLDYSETGEQEVPDPYYGGAAGFDRVLDLVEEGGQALLDYLISTHGLCPND